MPDEQEPSLLADSLDTVNKLYAENNELRKRLGEIRSVCGISSVHTPAETSHQLEIINNLRIIGMRGLCTPLETSKHHAKTATDSLIECMSIEELEFFVDTMSLAVASISAALRGSPTIRIRRQQREEEKKNIVDESRKRIESNTVRARAEEKVVRAESKAEEKAIRSLMKTGLTEEQARTMIKGMKGV